MGQMTHYHSCQFKVCCVKFKSFVSNAQLVSMADSYFLNFPLLDVAFVSWDISSDFLNRASHILQIHPSSLNAYAFLTKTVVNLASVRGASSA